MTYAQARDRAAQSTVDDNWAEIDGDKSDFEDVFIAGANFGSKYVLESAEVQEVIRILQRVLDGNMIDTGAIAFEAGYALEAFEKLCAEVKGE